MLGKYSTPQGTYLVLNTDFGKTSLASLLTFYLKLLLRFNSRVVVAMETVELAQPNIYT